MELLKDYYYVYEDDGGIPIYRILAKCKTLEAAKNFVSECTYNCVVYFEGECIDITACAPKQ